MRPAPTMREVQFDVHVESAAVAADAEPVPQVQVLARFRPAWGVDMQAHRVVVRAARPEPC